MNIINFAVYAIIRSLNNLCHAACDLRLIFKIIVDIFYYYTLAKVPNSMDNMNRHNAFNNDGGGGGGGGGGADDEPPAPMEQDDFPQQQLQQQQQQQQMPPAEPQILLNFFFNDIDDQFNDNDYDDGYGDDDDDDEDENYEDGNEYSIYESTTSDANKNNMEQNGGIYTFKPLRLMSVKVNQNNVPLPRSGHRTVATDSYLYALGGYNPNRPMGFAWLGRCILFQELWCFNFATQRWGLLLSGENNGNNGRMPRELASNALALYNNVLISHGGTDFPFGETCSNDCYVYSTCEKSHDIGVKRLNVTGDLPTAQYGPGIVIHEDYLYTIGGTTGFDYSCDVYRLNLRTKVWENVYICRPEMRDDPEGRYRHEVIYDGRHIYVLGGGTSRSVYDLQRIPAFNLSTNRWDYFNTLPDPTAPNATNGFPQPRKCFSCVQHTTSNGDIEAFVTGGMQADVTTYFTDIWKLNLRNKQWHCIRHETLPHPLYFHAAAHAGNTGCMYIFGGIEYSDKGVHRRNEIYKMWMTIPKLSEMCWDAITYYNRKLNRNDRNTLLASGIPERFVQRLGPLPYVLSTNNKYIFSLLTRPRSMSQ